MATESDTPALTMPVDPKRDHILGPVSAPVTLVEYGDFECPHCAHAHEILEELLPELADTVRFVFRNFPLTQIHPHAQRAAEAAEAAAVQGKFWEMHDMLFEKQDALEDDNLVMYAEALGLDVDRFTRELSEGTHRQRVSEDFRAGIRSGVNGTPTFFINGHRNDGGWDIDSLRRALSRAEKHHAHH